MIIRNERAVVTAAGRWGLAALAGMGVWASLASAAPPSNATHITIGKVTIDAGHFAGQLVAGGTLRLTSGVHMASPTYDLQADHITARFASAPGGPVGAGTFSQATAEGTPAKQVVGTFTQVEQAQKFQVFADRAVYVPEKGRPNGGRVDFTGHVKWVIRDPQALAEPSVANVGPLTVRLGPAPDYPQFEGDDLHMTVTPLQ